MNAGFEFERLTLNRVGSAGRGSLPALLFTLIFACATPPHALSASGESEPLVVLEFLNHFDWADMEFTITPYGDTGTYTLSSMDAIQVRSSFLCIHIEHKVRTML